MPNERGDENEERKRMLVGEERSIYLRNAKFSSVLPRFKERPLLLILLGSASLAAAVNVNNDFLPRRPSKLGR